MLASNRADRVDVWSVGALDIEGQFREWNQRPMVRVGAAHPSHPSVMHVLNPDALALGERENRVHPKQRPCIPGWNEFGRDRTPDFASQLVDVAQPVACRISSAA